MIQSCFMHTEGSQAFSKQFLMAAYGYKRNESDEQRFNSDFADKDWSYDPDSGDVGEVWREATGKRAIVEANVGKNNRTGEPMQQLNGWRPVE
jgi:hypothetical protein